MPRAGDARAPRVSPASRAMSSTTSSTTGSTVATTSPYSRPRARTAASAIPRRASSPSSSRVGRERPIRPTRSAREPLLAEVLGARPLHRPAILERCVVPSDSARLVAGRARRQRDDDVPGLDDVPAGLVSRPASRRPSSRSSTSGWALSISSTSRMHRGCSSAVEQRRRRRVAAVAGRRAEQARDLDRVGQLAAVEPEDGCALEAERRERIRQRLDRRRLAGARWAEQEHGAGSRRMALRQLGDRRARDPLERSVLPVDHTRELAHERSRR